MQELPNIVRERLKASGPIDAHLDADVLTAFAEHSLPEPERAVVLEHLARCHDCRDIVSLALPAIVTVETAVLPLPARKGGLAGWLGTPALRWGVVATGFAVLAVAGILQYQRRQQPELFIAARQTKASAPQGATVQVSSDEKSAKPTPAVPAAGGSANAAPAEGSRLDAGSANSKSAESAFTKEPATAASPAGGGASPLATSRLQTPQVPASRPAFGFAYGGPVGGSVKSGSVKQGSQLSARTAPPAPVTVEGQTQPLVENERVEVENQTDQLEAKNQQKDRPAAAMGGHPAIDVTVDKAKAPSTTVEVSAGAPRSETASAAPATFLLASRWAISPTGGLQRSFDQGRTWASVDVNANQSTSANLVALEVVPQNKKYAQTAQDMMQQQTPGQAQSKTLSKNQSMSPQKATSAATSIPVFRAVSAAGLEVWAGGSAGMLYHSADGGQQWTRVLPSAAGSALTGDIVGITFTDPQHGKIETSTFELWTTTDAGQTWHKP